MTKPTIADAVVELDNTIAALIAYHAGNGSRTLLRIIERFEEVAAWLELATMSDEKGGDTVAA
jgi:hypothetical protein